MTKAPNKIPCKVVRKSEWERPGDNAIFKTIELDIEPGNYYGSTTLETESDYQYGSIKLSIHKDVKTFFDKFKVGQKVELEIK